MSVERTLILIKPDAVRRSLAGEILARIEARGFGGTKPLISPDAKNAAKINDRIELIILERK